MKSMAVRFGAALLIAAPAWLLGQAPSNAAAPAPSSAVAKADFAGGCFWCMETAFVGVPGVATVTSGYTGGTKKNPTYEEVSSGGTGHAESVEVAYDPTRITYGRLLEIFWHNVDPLSANGQFCDRGNQYRSAIFFHSPEQAKEAQASKEALDKAHRYSKPIATQIVPAVTFYPAEDYHQQYLEKRGLASCHINT